MFDLPTNRRVYSDLPLITDAYEVLHWDQVPILFTGLNAYRNRVLASSVDEDDEAEFERYFHVIVRPEEYSKFVRREISYLSLLRGAQSVFVIDQPYDEAPSSIFLVEVNDIPDDYLPAEDSYCPGLRSDSIDLGERYQIALDGRWQFEDLGELPNLYIQVYSALYAFGEDRGANHDRVARAIREYPWKGGYSSVNFYTVLRNAVPPVDRPQIAAIQYASPGYLELSLAADVAVQIRRLIERYLERDRYWDGAYSAHYSYMSQRGLLRGGAAITLEDLSREDASMLAEALATMSDLLGKEFISLTLQYTTSPVVATKIVHSFYRRLSRLARFQYQHLASF